METGTRAERLRDPGEGLEPGFERAFGLGEIRPITDGADDAQRLGGQTEGLLAIDAHQRERAGDYARHATESGAQGQSVQEFIERTDLVRVRQRDRLRLRVLLIA